MSNHRVHLPLTTSYKSTFPFKKFQKNLRVIRLEKKNGQSVRKTLDFTEKPCLPQYYCNGLFLSVTSGRQQTRYVRFMLVEREDLGQQGRILSRWPVNFLRRFLAKRGQYCLSSSHRKPIILFTSRIMRSSYTQIYGPPLIYCLDSCAKMYKFHVVIYTSRNPKRYILHRVHDQADLTVQFQRKRFPTYSPTRWKIRWRAKISGYINLSLYLRTTISEIIVNNIKYQSMISKRRLCNTQTLLQYSKRSFIVLLDIS